MDHDPPSGGSGGATPRYRLRGGIGGVERRYDVLHGDNRIGSLQGNDIVLALRGVSRQHACLRCGADGLTVEDLGSPNGVLVNGLRVQRAPLRAGDEIRLGPAVLRLEEVQPADEGAAARNAAPLPGLYSTPVVREEASVAAGTIACGALIAQVVAGKATRDALFLSSFDVRALPPVMIASSLFAMGAVLAFSRALVRHTPARVTPLAVGASATLLAGEWAVSLASPRLAALLVYLHTAVFGATLVSAFWSLVNERFDPYSAKRVVGRIAMGGSLGGVAGGLLVWRAARVVPVPSMLLVIALINVIGLVALLRLRGRGLAAEAERPRQAGVLEGFRILRDVPYLRHVAVIVGLGAISEVLLDYNLKAEAAAAFSCGPELISFFAMFHAGVGLAAIVAQGLLARGALERLGLSGTAALLPAAVAAGGLGGALAPSLSSAVLARGSQAMLNASLFRAAYELLFTAVAEHRKRSTKTIVDVGFDKLGGVLGGAVALLVLALAPQAARRVLFGLCVLSAFCALALARLLRRGYVAALEENLRAGVVRLDPEGIVDPGTRFTLTQTGLFLAPEARFRELEGLRGWDGAAAGAPLEPLARITADLRSADPATVRRTLLRQEALDPRLAAHVIPLLGRSDVSLDALRALRGIAPRVTGQLVDALLDANQAPAARRRIPGVLKLCDSQRAADGLLLGLRDADFELRRRCGLALLRLTEGNRSIVVPEEAAFEAARRELGATLPDAADPRGAEKKRLDHVFNLLALALEREPLHMSYWAVRREDTLRGVALEYLDTVLPESVRDALWPHLGVPVQPTPTRRSRQEVVDKLVRAFAVRRAKRNDAGS